MKFDTVIFDLEILVGFVVAALIIFDSKWFKNYLASKRIQKDATASSLQETNHKVPLPVMYKCPIKTLAYEELDPSIPTVFLDIDGVLHRFCNETFERKELLESWLCGHECQIVLSSNWRESNDADQLEEVLGSYIWSRVVGFTPVLDYIEGQGTREREIYEFASFYNLKSFICIDDCPELFNEEPSVPVIFTRPDKALTAETMIELDSWYASVR